MAFLLHQYLLQSFVSPEHFAKFKTESFVKIKSRSTSAHTYMDSEICVILALLEREMEIGLFI